jgi:hypothetical protein
MALALQNFGATANLLLSETKPPFRLLSAWRSLEFCRCRRLPAK